jgi:hypothetical protein
MKYENCRYCVDWLMSEILPYSYRREYGELRFFIGRRMKLTQTSDIRPFTKTEKLLEATSKFIGNFFLSGEHDVIGE